MGFKPAKDRMEVIESGGVTLFNDTYNANPDSTIAALHTLASVISPGKKIAVLADMRELGTFAPEEHERVGRELQRVGIEYLLTYGEMARHIHDAAGVPNKFHYDQKNVLAEFLFELLAAGDAVLVKGSRGMRMEDVVSFLRHRLDAIQGKYSKTGTE
jgi:UDP-N-acetylmuramoyl-tripeptide--D-alanyl-D-alanine ligase